MSNNILYTDLDVQSPASMKIGTDILSFKRFSLVLNKFENRLTNKILSKAEKELYLNISSERRRLEFLGGRFCGKEAIFKAVDDCGTNLTWQRLSILPTSKGAPEIFIDGKKANNMILSISHEQEYAIATAINF